MRSLFSNLLSAVSKRLSTHRKLPRKSRQRRLFAEALETRKVFSVGIPEIYISEIQDDPLFGSRDTDQYVELRGTANSTLPAGTYFVVLEGWGAVPGGPGYLHSVIDLSNLSFGANGFLTITQLGSPYQVDPQSTRLVSNSTGFAGLPDGRWSDDSTLSDRLSFISGTQSFMLIAASVMPDAGEDYDQNDDGNLDHGADLWTIYDSVAMMGSSSPGWSYGRITFSENTTNHRYPAGSVYIVQEGIGYVDGRTADPVVCGVSG